MDAVNVLSLSQQPDGSDHHHHHLQGVHHFAMGDDHGHHHGHHHLSGAQFVVRDGQQHFVLDNQQALMALVGDGHSSHEDHPGVVNKLELRWTERGFCDARGETVVKDVTGVRWEPPPLYTPPAAVVASAAAAAAAAAGTTATSVIDGNHVNHVGNHGSHHVVLQEGGGRWEDPSLCDAGNDEEDVPNDGDLLDPKRTREVRWTEQALCDALQAVKSGTLTAYKASKDYGIPRSTLRNWLNGRNRSRKRGPRVEEALSFCRQDTAEPSGANAGSLIEVGVNSEDGDEPWQKRRLVWTKNTLFEALSAVRSGELTVSKAAQVYGIPNSTLDYWMKEHEKKSGEMATAAPGYVQTTATYQHAREEAGCTVPISQMMIDEEEEDEEEEDDEEEEGGDEQMVGISEKKERLKKKAREGKKRVGGWTEKALSEAMEAIKNNTLTICKASRAYGIPRTTLRNWITGRTRSRKRGPHTGLPFENNGDASLAAEDFQYNEVSGDLTPGREENGDDQPEGGKGAEQALLDVVEAVRSSSCTIGTAGQQFGIPQSALKYSLNGVVSKKSPSVEGKNEDDVFEADEKSKKNNGWTEQALQNALQAIRNGFSIRKAGQHFGIPRTTLRNWLNGRTHSRKRGPHGGMTRGEQESAIVEWFFSVQQVSQSLMTLNSLRRRVSTLSVNKGSPFKDGVPVKKWWVWFNRRHPDVAARVGEGLQEAQNRNLIDELSVVHMVTGEHLQILRRRLESEQEEDKMELALGQRGDDMDSCSQDDEQDDPSGSAAADVTAVLDHHQHLVENGLLNPVAPEDHVMV